jgi:hypothetical protein
LYELHPEVERHNLVGYFGDEVHIVFHHP